MRKHRLLLVLLSFACLRCHMRIKIALNRGSLRRESRSESNSIHSRCPKPFLTAFSRKGSASSVSLRRSEAPYSPLPRR